MLMEEIEGFKFQDSISDDHEDEAINYYIAGDIARCIMESISRLICHESVVSVG